MNREKILEISRKENKNRDLAELEILSHAGNIAGRVGACVCILISLIYRRVANTFLFSSWIIYFSILGTNYLVRFIKIRKKTDLAITVIYYTMCTVAAIFFALRLAEVRV